MQTDYYSQVPTAPLYLDRPDAIM